MESDEDENSDNGTRLAPRETADPNRQGNPPSSLSLRQEEATVSLVPTAPDPIRQGNPPAPLAHQEEATANPKVQGMRPSLSSHEETVNANRPENAHSSLVTQSHAVSEAILPGTPPRSLFSHTGLSGAHWQRIPNKLLYQSCLECIQKNLVEFIFGKLSVDKLKLIGINPFLKIQLSHILPTFHSIIRKILDFSYKRAKGNHPQLFTDVYCMPFGKNFITDGIKEVTRATENSSSIDKLMNDSGWDGLPFESRRRSKLVFSQLLISFIKMEHKKAHEGHDLVSFRPQMPEWLRLEVGKSFDERPTYTIPDFPQEDDDDPTHQSNDVVDLVSP